MLRVLFCQNPLAPAAPEPAFAAEAQAAHELGLAVGFIDYDALANEGDLRRCLRRLGPVEPGPTLYRGWMLRAEAYESLHVALAERGLVLVTAPPAYALAHHWPEAYPYLAPWTVRTIWLEAAAPSETALHAKLAEFGNRPVVIKDWVKSQANGYWDTACFIPDASDLRSALSVVHRFIELQGTALTGGLVLRDYVALSRIAGQVEEWRVFVADGCVVTCHPRCAAPADPPPADLVGAVARSLPCRFFSADFARREDGGWLLIETGDGQVSELPASADRTSFYIALDRAFGAVTTL